MTRVRAVLDLQSGGPSAQPSGGHPFLGTINVMRFLVFTAVVLAPIGAPPP